MKAKIIELLNTKNDKKENIFNFSPSIVPTTPWKYSTKEDMRYYLWLCQLQKWIREEYRIYIEILSYNDEEVGQTLWENEIIDVEDDWNEFSDYTYYHDYEEALESGIYEVLTILIRNNGKNNQ